jgi:NADPH2:quinone reductase
MTRAPRPNWRPGWDLAGVVEKAAEDGTGPHVGARVVGLLRAGAWAEQVSVPTDALAEIPENVTFAQAATLPVAGLTAYHALYKGGLLLGKNVLVTGASGGVGEYAIQLGRLCGAVVTAHVRRPEQEAAAREAGADNVVVGETPAEAKVYGPFALMIDSVGGPVLGTVLGMVGEGTVVVSLGTSAGNSVTFDAQKFYGVGMASLYGLILFDELKKVESAAVGLARLAKLVGSGKLVPRISLEADWSEVDSVAQQLLDRAYPGKAVLSVA